MNIKGLVTFFTLISFGVLHAQGLIMDDEFYGSMPRQSEYGDGGKAELEAIKGIHKKSLKKFSPMVQHQGRVSSCVGWSCGYGALTMQKALQNDWQQTDLITDSAFSALFIFNQIKITDCGFGSRIGDALRLLKSKGNVLSKNYDTDKEDCFKEITSSDLEQAADHKIMDFMTLFSSKSDGKVKINKTKLSLIQNRPVIIGMNLLNNFIKIPYRDSVWYPSVGDKAVFGGHAMVVVGFDDGLEAFEIMNSWGSTWANDGFVWVKYKDYEEYCRYGYQMILEDQQAYEAIYAANFAIKKKVITLADGTILFKDEIPTFNGEYYIFKEKEFKHESIFQFIGSEFNDNIYLYAFSLDPDGKLKVHWPRDEQLDEQFTGMHESALITVSNAELYFPSRDNAFFFDKSGKDYVCFLYATHPLENINEQLSQFTQLSDHPLQRLYKVFGESLMELSDINYTARGIGFRNKIPAGKIVPMIVEFQIGG